MKIKLFIVSILFLMCAAGFTSAREKTLFMCSGTEPFWNAEVTGTMVKFHLMAEDSVIFSYSEILKAQGVGPDYIRIFKLENDKVKPAYLIIKQTEKCKCSDGMSDNEYEYESILIMDKIIYSGCANKK